MKTIDIPTDDPLRMIWAVREKIYEDTKDMSTDQWNDYVQKGVDEFEREMAKRGDSSVNRENGIS